jgi:CheY-like chemotaxis protein
LKVLIVENEVYLAQSISNKLQNLGYEIKFATCVKEAIKIYKEDEYIHTVLLSTNLGEDFNNVIKTYNKSIIILLNSYINNDTVTTPLSIGASDYILKPFLMDELIRKIEHYKEFERLKYESYMMSKYVDITLNMEENVDFTEEIKFPLIIKTNSTKSADRFIFKLANKLKRDLDFIDLGKIDTEDIKTIDNRLKYFVNFDNINYNDKKHILEKFGKEFSVFVTIEDVDFDIEDFSIFELKSNDMVFSDMKILPISEYVKLMIVKHQDKMPDIRISEMLGISRKSLWEKRKKYGIEKQ